MPNLYKNEVTAEEREFYYKAMLVLVKPHDFITKNLMESYDSYENAYRAFVGGGSMAAIDARIQDELFTNYYLNEAVDVAEAGATEEDQVFRDHAFTDQENDPRVFGSAARRRCERDHSHNEEAVIVEEMVKDSFDDKDVDMLLNIAPERAELPEEIRTIFEVTKLLHPGNKLDADAGDLPAFTNFRSFKESLIDPSTEKPEHVKGVSMFNGWKEKHDVKIKMLSEYFEPVPWTEPPIQDMSFSDANLLKAAKISKLRKFDSIKNISIAMQLNFWQHHVFQSYARHLMYNFALDISDDDAQLKAALAFPEGTESTFLKTQLMGYVGGIAGSGKSAVIAAILTFARLWGRRDTVETMSFTGLASQQVEGNTIHQSRGLATYSNAPRISEDVALRVRRIYLTIIDEISMVGQKLCGSAECITRFYRNKQQLWGGIDIMLCGDFLQLPPVRAVPIYKPPSDKRGSTNYTWYLAGYNLFTQCNFVVFLTDNMRQKQDQQYCDLLERMHWGVNTQQDIDLLNTRSLQSGHLDIEGHYRQYEDTIDDYFTPMAISTNKQRCGFNKETIYAICKKERCTVYEVLAQSSKVENRAIIQRLKYMDDDFTDKLPFLLTFHTHGMPAMVTKRIEKLEKLNCISNGTLGFVIGYAHHGSKTTCVAPNYVDDDSMFRVTITSDNLAVKRFKKQPDYLLFKIRNCNRQLFKKYPPGVVPIPLASYKAQFCLPGSRAETTMMVTTFPLIPAYAMTPEKLQGVTLEHELFVSELACRSPQILYVVYSRARALIKLILTELLTMDYVRKFLPSEELIHLVNGFIDKIQIPDYMPTAERAKFIAWVAEQKKYVNEAIQLHRERRITRLPVTSRKRTAVAVANDASASSSESRKATVTRAAVNGAPRTKR